MRKKLAMKICAIAMTAAMVGTMAGCGNDSGSSSSAGDESSAESPAESGSEEQGGADESSEETPAESGEAEGEGEAAGGETYDFGGAVVKVNGGPWGILNPENEGTNPDYELKWDNAHQVEQKYNIKFEYVKLEGDDGYNTQKLILSSFTSGEAFADIMAVGDNIILGLKDYMADITDTVDQLEIGNIYVEPGRWNGHVYGWTFDNMGSVYVMAYSRDYLNSIGMDVTPTQKFLAGEWSYDECKAYLTELKAKLPEGTYPMGVHTNHWASMAPAANGAVSVDSNGGIHLTDDNYIESLEFYRELIDLGLAAPITDVTIDEESGGISSTQLYGNGDMCGHTEAKSFVITMVEAWQMEGLLDGVGEWGIVPWPWGSAVTCEGDYTTLSDNYYVAQSIWTDMTVAKQEYRSEGAKEIPDIVLHMIARDFMDLDNPSGAAVRHAAWEAEKAGQTYENLGYSPGTIGSFSTEEDAALYDWLHTRVVVDWGHCMNENSLVRVNRNAAYVIAAGRDARSSGESFKNEGEQNLADLIK